MSYNNERLIGSPLFFDIETVGNPEAVSVLGPVKPAGNLKDPAKIAADIADKEAKRIERAALDCDTARIVCIGLDYRGEAIANWCHDKGEDNTIRAFWITAKNHRAEFPTAPLVGFNCLQFDLPVLIRRSQVLGIPVPSLELGRYRHAGIIDLMQLLTWDGLVDAKPLSVYCRLFGLDVPDDDSTGADVAALAAAGEWNKIAAYCRADVTRTRALYERVTGKAAAA